MQFHAQSDILLQPFWLPDGGPDNEHGDAVSAEFSSTFIII